MNKFKPILLFLCTLLGIILVVPTALVVLFSADEEIHRAQENAAPQTHELERLEPDVEVAVYRSMSKEIESLPLEEYVVGVVASEMPAEFEMEALKAQALSARTYIVKHMLTDNILNTPEGATVTDTTLHQVYKNRAELKEIWGNDYDWKIERIEKAVQATAGQIITYNNEPITASFFSTSNGYTENSEDYWQNQFPYLRSVESPWDTASPKFLAQKIIPVQQVEETLDITLSGDSIGKILSLTEGKRVAKVELGGKTFDGREVREALELNSTDFTFKRSGNNIIFTTRGWGHGVGMSQYGANGMAQEGKKVKDIIQHYYQGSVISNVDPQLLVMH